VANIACRYADRDLATKVPSARLDVPGIFFPRLAFLGAICYPLRGGLSSRHPDTASFPLHSILARKLSCPGTFACPSKELPMSDDSDLLADSRMPLGDHIEELRLRLWRAIIGYLVAVVLGFLVSRPLFLAIAAPIDRELRDFHQRRLASQQQKLEQGDGALTRANEPREVPLEVRLSDFRVALGLPPDNDEAWVVVPARIRPASWMLATAEAHYTVLHKPGLTALTITEPFMVYFKVSLVLGLVLASPWIFYQLWAFVAAGLYPHERRLVYVFLPLSLGLFLGGVALCQLVVLPAGVSYLLSYYEWLDVEPGLRLGDWLNFALWMPVAFGLSFQTPLVMLALERIGLFSVAAYRNNRRIAIFLLAVLAAVVSVTPDWFNMLALAAPLWLLYELGIVLCRLSARRDSEEDEESGPLVDDFT
jgi:sec-independent protein translocase protein TatC